MPEKGRAKILRLSFQGEKKKVQKWWSNLPKIKAETGSRPSDSRFGDLSAIAGCLEISWYTPPKKKQTRE